MSLVSIQSSARYHRDNMWLTENHAQLGAHNQKFDWSMHQIKWIKTKLHLSNYELCQSWASSLVEKSVIDMVREQAQWELIGKLTKVGRKRVYDRNNDKQVLFFQMTKSRWYK